MDEDTTSYKDDKYVIVLSELKSLTCRDLAQELARKLAELDGEDHADFAARNEAGLHEFPFPMATDGEVQIGSDDNTYQPWSKIIDIDSIAEALRTLFSRHGA